MAIITNDKIITPYGVEIENGREIVRNQVKLVLGNGVEISDGYNFVKNSVMGRRVTDEKLLEKTVDEIISIQEYKADAEKAIRTGGRVDPVKEERVRAMLEELKKRAPNPNDIAPEDRHVAVTERHVGNLGLLSDLDHDMYKELLEMPREKLKTSKFGITNGKLTMCHLSVLCTSEYYNIQDPKGAERLKEDLVLWGWDSPMLLECIDKTGPAFTKLGMKLDTKAMLGAITFEKQTHDLGKFRPVMGYSEQEIKKILATNAWGPNTRQLLYAPNGELRSLFGQRELFEMLGPPPRDAKFGMMKSQQELADIARAVFPHNYGEKHHPDLSTPGVYLTLPQAGVMERDWGTYGDPLRSVVNFRGNYNYDDQCAQIFANGYEQRDDYIRRHGMERTKVAQLFPQFKEKDGGRIA